MPPSGLAMTNCRSLGRFTRLPSKTTGREALSSGSLPLPISRPKSTQSQTKIARIETRTSHIKTSHPHSWTDNSYIGPNLHKGRHPLGRARPATGRSGLLCLKARPTCTYSDQYHKNSDRIMVSADNAPVVEDISERVEIRIHTISDRMSAGADRKGGNQRRERRVRSVSWLCCSISSRTAVRISSLSWSSDREAAVGSAG